MHITQSRAVGALKRSLRPSMSPKSLARMVSSGCVQQCHTSEEIAFYIMWLAHLLHHMTTCSSMHLHFLRLALHEVMSSSPELHMLPRFTFTCFLLGLKLRASKMAKWWMLDTWQVVQLVERAGSAARNQTWKAFTNDPGSLKMPAVAVHACSILA